jgi:phosphoribosylamine--glycine ligase
MDTILLPLVEGFNLQNINYRGVIYAGLMIENDQPRVVEFNCRFGDPEAEAVLPLLQSDLGEALHRAAAGTLRDFTLDWRPGYACDVVMVSGGYPGSYKKGLPISGLDAAAESDDVFVFHAGTRRAGDVVVTDGGRVLNVVALGDTLGEAVEKSYRKVESIAFEGAHVRRDIGHKGLARVK